jgi:hypothetical protein
MSPGGEVDPGEESTIKQGVNRENYLEGKNPAAIAKGTWMGNSHTKNEGGA